MELIIEGLKLRELNNSILDFIESTRPKVTINNKLDGIDIALKGDYMNVCFITEDNPWEGIDESVMVSVKTNENSKHANVLLNCKAFNKIMFI